MREIETRRLRDERPGNHSGPITTSWPIGIPVTDQDRALEFYLERWGSRTPRFPTPQVGGRWIEVAPPGAA